MVVSWCRVGDGAAVVLHSGGAGGQPEKPGAGHLFATRSGMECFGRNPWAQSAAAVRFRREDGCFSISPTKLISQNRRIELLSI